MLGLVDMHTHLLSDSDEFPDSIGPHELRVMVANGVTTVRFMIGTPELLALRSRSANSETKARRSSSAPAFNGTRTGKQLRR